MKNIILITKREFLTQVKKKSFFILTLLMPLLIVGFGALISLMFKANETTNTFNVIDKSGLFRNNLKSNGNIVYINVPETAEKALTDSLKEMTAVDGLLIIPEVENGNFNKIEENTKLLTNKEIGLETKKAVSEDLEIILRKEKITNLGLEESQIENIQKGFSLNTKNIASDNQNDNDEDIAFGVKYGLSIILMYSTFMFIMIYGVRIMRSILEEKNNRVVEIIISSVKPFELMIGKILGVTLVAITQFSIWITMTIIAAVTLNTKFSGVQQLPTETTENIDFQNIAMEVSHILLEMNFVLIISVFLIFFLLGYIFYSAMYAAIGSAVDNETESQQFTLLAVLPLMVGMYGSFTFINNPEGPLAFWLSIIPFTSPVAMVARIPFGVSAWEILLSVVLLVISTLSMVYIASKVYKVGILMYGNKASWKEIWKWIKS